MTTTILWVYIGLLLVGGLMGFLKAGSKISLITSAAFALALGLVALGILRPAYWADILLGVLLLVFGIRFMKGRKFMPAGLMCALTVVTLILRHLS